MSGRQAERPGAREWEPTRLTRSTLAWGIAACQGCDLYHDPPTAKPANLLAR